MGNPNTGGDLLNVLAHSKSPSLKPEKEEWRRVNPKWSMVARILVSMLSNQDVIPRLARAQSSLELKAILFVDRYLTITRNIGFKLQIRELLANAQVPIEEIETWAALSFAYEAVMPPDGKLPGKQEMLYPVPAAAIQLGVEPDVIYQGILNDQVQAELYITRSEIERLLHMQREKLQ